MIVAAHMIAPPPGDSDFYGNQATPGLAEDIEVFLGKTLEPDKHATKVRRRTLVKKGKSGYLFGNRRIERGRQNCSLPPLRKG